MSEEKPPSRHVAFAERFASGSFSDFNAFAALKRARLLLREARQIAEIFELEEKREDPAMWSRHGLEVVPYTLVGYVTCLEWHARSRITDLYSYRPDSIDSKVLERKVPGRILSQMIRANVSVPQFLGASITIGSTGDYLAVFDELFKTLDINRKPADVITSRGGVQIGLFGDPIREPSTWEQLEALFTSRHVLVHELGHDAGAGRTLCETWSADQIIWMGHTVVSAMSALERALTEHAPADFPNLLTEQGRPVDAGAQLAASIDELERRISQDIEARSRGGFQAWIQALTTARQSLADHDRLVGDRELFQPRHIGRENLLLRAALEQRLALLTRIEAELAKSRSATPRRSDP